MRRIYHCHRLIPLTLGCTLLCACNSSTDPDPRPRDPCDATIASHDTPLRDALAPLVRAFCIVESSGINRRPYLDCNRKHTHREKCYAFGLFAFHLPRWLECGGTRNGWGTASTGEQEDVMRMAIVRAWHDWHRKGTPGNFITWCANYHNLGHGSTRETRYTTLIRKELTHANDNN